MRIDKGQISGIRFMFTIVFFLQSSALLTSFLAGITKHDAWITVILGTVVCIPLILVFRTLMVMFPEKNLIQILDQVYGPFLGKVLSVAYIWFFITLASLNLKDLGDFVKITMMRETPHEVLALLGILVAVWAVRNGIKVVTRYCVVFTFVEFAVLGISLLLLINQIDFQNLLPMFDLPPMKYVQSTHISATIPLGELVVFLMIIPNVRLSRREATKYWLLGVGMGMGTVLLVLLRDITVLGNTLELFALPGLASLRLVNLGEAFSRMEILFAVALVMLLFFKIAFLCYAVVIAIAQIFKIKDYKHLALAAAMLVLVYMTTLYPNTTRHSLDAQQIQPVVWTLFEILLPALTFIIALARKLPKERKTVKEG